MIKTLAEQIKEFKKASILTPVFMILEVLFEMMIPLLWRPLLIMAWKREILVISAR